MDKNNHNSVTELSDHDKKVLDKYTKTYTNFIESGTAENDMLQDDRNDYHHV